MFEQYWKIRDQIDPETLLFYRMGDFYELFGEDAVKAASVLEVQLTARNKDAEIPVPMCGVPAHAVDSYAEKLLSRKFKVALCEQLTDPEESKAKLVERGIVRILTPGLPVDPSKLDSKSAHYFLSLHVSNAKSKTCEIEVLVLDFLGGELFSGVLSSTPELDELLLKIDPKEILLSQNLLTRPTPELARSFLFDQAREYFSRITPWAAGEKASASGNLKEYLHYTQRAKNSALASELPEPQSLSKIFGAQSADFAQISHAVLTQWNVLPELFELLDGCGSALGSRALQNILSRPLASVSRIRVRQNFLEKALPDESEILSLSRNVYDLERILGRFRVGVAAPKELLELFQSLVGVMAVLNRLDHFSSDVRAFYDAEELENFQQLSKRVEPLMELMSRMLETSGEKLQSSLLADLIRSGFDETLDGLRSLHSGAEEWLRNLEDRLRAETDIPSLKVRYNRVFGYFVEVTKTHLAKVPSYFERKQTTVSGERFTLPELRAKESEILSASSKLESRARELLENLQKELLAHSVDLKSLFAQFAWVDALSGTKFKISALRRFGEWNQPSVAAGDFFVDLEEARHPILESRFASFVPNSVRLGQSSKRLLLLTGPNMAGKSTLMRQLGLCLLLAQCGFPVPASQMNFAPCTGFFSRMGAQDKILEGESTFMVEMKETAFILRECTRNSLVLMDEIGRGTSTQDGLALAEAILEYLSDKSQCVGIFATHYHELSTKPNSFKAMQNASMAIVEEGRELKFLHRLKNEAAESSYGLYVARLAGLPKALLVRAGTLLERAQKKERELGAVADTYQGEDLFSFADEKTVSALESFEEVSSDDSAQESSTPGASQNESLFTKPSRIEENIRSLDLDSMSPREAWALIENWKKELGSN